MSRPESAFSIARLFPGGWPERLWLAWVTAVLPGIAFYVSMQQIVFASDHSETWQRDDLGIWADLLIGRSGSAGFLPIALPVMAVGLAIALRPGPWAEAYVVRLVVAFGVLLSLQYAVLVLMAIASEDLSAGLVTFIAVAMAVIHGLSIGSVRVWRWLRRRLPRRGLWALVLGVGAVLWTVISTLLWLDHGDSWFEALLRFPQLVLLVALFVSLVAGPVWSLRALILLLLRLGGVDLVRLSAPVAAAAAYAVAWRIALSESITAYASLPTRAPDCFVATAAAGAPARLVGGFRITTAGGRPFRVTHQLQRLKALELVIEGGSPRIHRRLRAVYDALGPRLASRIHSPLRCALVWLLLKPFEWTAVALVRTIAGIEGARKTARIYRSIRGAGAAASSDPPTKIPSGVD